MRAITICNPYPHMIVTPQDELPIGIIQKRVENRSWPTRYRGPLLIHAGKSKSYMQEDDWDLFPNLVWGAAVGVCDVVDCFPPDRRAPAPRMYPRPVAPDWALKKWPFLDMQHQHIEGKYCLVLDNVRRLPKPIPCRGKQQLWEPDEELRQKVERSLNGTVK